MVTVPEYEKQLQIRRQTVEVAQKEVSSFQPKIKRTQEELRKATPLLQARVKGVVAEREESKRKALTTVEKEFQEQQKLEKEFVPVKQKYEKQQREYQSALKEQQEWETAQKLATGKQWDRGYWISSPKSIRKKVTQIRAGFTAGVKKIQEQLQKGEKLILDKSNLRIKGVESGAFGMSFPSIEAYNKAIGISNPLQGVTALEKELKMSIPSGIRDLTLLEYESKMSMAPKLTVQDLLRDIEKSKPLPVSTMPTFPSAPSVVSMPSFTEKVRGEIRQVIGISLPAAPTLPKPTVTEMLVPPLYTKRVFVEKVWPHVKELPEQIPAMATATYEKLGVPTITKEIDIPERKFFERGTSILEPKTGKYVLPEPQIVPGAPTIEITKLSPEKLGRLTTLPLYLIPYVGAGLVGIEIGKGVEAYKTPVPSVIQLIKEQTPELSMAERSEYLKTEEGKEYEKGVKDYVAELERQKKIGLGVALLGTAALAVPTAFIGGKRLYRAGKDPFKVVVTAPEKSFFTARAVTTGEVSEGLVTRATILPKGMAEVPTYKTWYSKLTSGKLKIPESAFEYKPDVDITIQPFKIVGEKGASLGATRKFGPTKTLTKLEQTLELQRPTEIMDFSKLPKEWRYISKALPARDIKGVTTFMGVGQTFKGWGIGVGPKVSIGPKSTLIDVPVRLQRYSKYQRQFYMPTERMAAPYTKTISRVKRVGTFKDAQLYAVEAAAKTTKEIKGIAKGVVAEDVGLVLIKQVPEKGAVEYISKSTKLLKKTKQKQLAVRIQQLVPPPKPKPFKWTKPTVKAPVETFVFSPRMVGGLGRKVSQYAGKGLYETTSPTITFIPSAKITGVTAPVSIETQLVFTKPEERIDFVQTSVTGEKLGEGLIEISVEKEKEKLAVVPSYVQPVKMRDALIPKQQPREDLVPKLDLKMVQVQKPKPIPPKHPTPKPRPPKPPTPKPPKPIVIILPSTKPVLKKPVKKKKIEEELFLPFVRRYGKFVPVTIKPLPKKKAIKKGLVRVRGTLAAALQIRRPTGEIIPFAKPTKEFRLGREMTIVQKAPRRLGRREEVAEIIASRRAGAMRFIK